MSTTATQGVDSGLVLERGRVSFPTTPHQEGSQTIASSPNLDRSARCGGRKISSSSASLLKALSLKEKKNTQGLAM